jgi:D-cysteine desulfhydrase
MKLPNRLSLARLPTPIQKLKHTSLELKKDVYIWRDDLTGFIDSGNKLRKLEFFMADATSQGCDWIITCGGPQSNHTRATSAVARSLGLGVSVLILPKMGFDRAAPANANLLLNQIFDAKISWIDTEEFHRLGGTYDPFFAKEVEELKRAGKKPYVIPLGGSNMLGCYGYINGVQEMLTAWKNAVPHSPAPDDLFCALGSGGTFVGLKLGLQDQNLQTKLHGINVIGPVEVAQKYVSVLSEASKRAGLELKSENMQFIDGYVGAGYAVASDADLRFYQTFAHREGIVLDPCYTGKAIQGMISEIKKNPSAFGEKILFLHSGGAFGNFAYAEQYQRVFQEKML